jgi:hypothetical protein
MSKLKKPNRVNVNVSLNPAQERSMAKIIKWMQASGREEVPVSTAMKELTFLAARAMSKGVTHAEYIRRDV